MQYYGLIGEKLSHSFSQKWFREKFQREHLDAEYLLIEARSAAEAIQLALHNHHLKGFNVTIPFKQTILPLCDVLDETVEKIGAANCVRVNNGKMSAFNTDVDGFQHLLDLAVGGVNPQGAMILGSGGGAAAVAYVLKGLKIPILRVSRNPNPGFSMAYHEISQADLINFPLMVNTTPLGMFPEIANAPPIPYHLLTGQEIMIDLVYNPAQTVFMKEGLLRGCQTLNGMPMLIRQAERSWEIWEK
jgi:shikimate dehydrogenase